MDLVLSKYKDQEDKSQQSNGKMGKEQPTVYRNVNITGS